MYLRISKDNALSLEQADDFGRFSIMVEERETSGWQTATGFTGIAQDAGGDHYWLDADAVASLSPKGEDADWLEAYWSMLAKSEPYGYYDTAKRKLKAHVE